MTVREKLLAGLVIPAHPLALTAQRKLDERRQRALTRYYLAAGAGGLAVGVHTTQFSIRDRGVDLLRPVLELTGEEAKNHDVVKIAGVCGQTRQAVAEAELAASLGYDAGLLSLGAFAEASVDELLSHVRTVASTIAVMGFYLQPGVGGRVLSYEFWTRFAQIDNVVAIKIAPFNRYRTIDVVRAIAESGRAREIALYTGNDDSIVVDLLSRFHFGGNTVWIAGGLLGQWAVWTSRAVELLKRIRQIVVCGAPIPAELLTLSQQITDTNAALFDPENDYRGCIPGIHEILRRQGLLAGRWCLDASEDLSPGQEQQINRVCQLYPHLQDDAFVREHLDEWLS